MPLTDAFPSRGPVNAGWPAVAIAGLEAGHPDACAAVAKEDGSAQMPPAP